jgi:hypothetical protein
MSDCSLISDNWLFLWEKRPFNAVYLIYACLRVLFIGSFAFDWRDSFHSSCFQAGGLQVAEIESIQALLEHCKA